MIGRSAFAVVALLALVPVSAPADDDSPWPEHGSPAAQIRAVRAVVSRLERKVALMEWSAARYADWRACIRRVPVSEYGDPDRQFGYAYDEGDGSGRGYMPALAVDRTSRPRHEDYMFLAFRRGGGCHSHAPKPGGTAEAAASSLQGLERRVRRLKRSARRLLAASERFDAWESCVSQVPVTEYGDPDGGFGYLFGKAGARSFAHRPALAIDRSDRDDPDYMLLAFVGGNRPGKGCRTEAGEAVVAAPPTARPASAPDRIEELQQELDSLTEDVEDLEAPVAEFELFEECMYLIGATEYGARGDGPGYRYGRSGTRPALAFDMRGFGRPAYQFLAFPAEEPPSIECNEDAEEEDTNDD